MLKKKTLADIKFTEEQISLLLEHSADELVGTEKFKNIPRRLLREKRNELINEFVTTKTSYKQSQETATAIGKSSDRVLTEEQLLEKCNVNLDVWYVERFEVNKWEIARKDTKKDLTYSESPKGTTITKGTVQDTGKMHVQELFQLKLYLKRKLPAGFNEKKFREELIKDVLTYYNGQNKSLYELPKINIIKGISNNNILLVNIFDMHFDKLAWREETGFDWDSKIASELFNNAVEDLVAQASQYKFEEIWFPVGNDFFNSDKAYPFTATTRGTPQQSDSRWQKVFRDGRMLLGEAITRFTGIAPVIVPIIPGNHDYEKVFYLGDSLECFFHYNDNVDIINVSDWHNYPRKYFTYGSNLIGFTHGKEEKTNDLHSIMSVESPFWSDCKYRYMYIGHFHHTRSLSYLNTEDFKGLHIEFLPSLTAADEWHHSKGFVGIMRGAKAFVHNAEKGRNATFEHWL